MKTEIDVIIETPKGSRNKYSYSAKNKLFKLKKTLPQGTVFPFDFGFIPDTKGGDGDPLDVLVIMDEPAYPGIMVKCRVIGALKAIQGEKGDMKRNDRVIAVYSGSATYADLKDLGDLNGNMLNEIEHFFISYNEQEGRRFKVLEKASVKEAMKIIENDK